MSERCLFEGCRFVAAPRAVVHQGHHQPHDRDWCDTPNCHPWTTDPTGLTVERLAAAIAVVFAYNASNASVAPDGSLSFGTGGTSYWRDRAKAVLAALVYAETQP